MKVIWEPTDIRAGAKSRNPNCTETWMIGYESSVHGRNTPAFALISLIDGMISHKGLSAQEMANLLNSCAHMPVELIEALKA